MDLLLTAKRDKAAARRYLERAINLHGLPEKITIDKSGANTTAIHSVNQDAWLSDLEMLSSHFYASCTLLRQNQAAPGSGVRMHGLPRRIHLRHQDAAAFRLGNVQMAILRAAKRHIGRHVFFAGIDSKDRHAQG